MGMAEDAPRGRGNVNDGAAPLWSDDQRDWLQALGHVVYVQAADAVPALEEEPDRQPVPADEPVRASMPPQHAPQAASVAAAQAPEHGFRRAAAAPQAPKTEPAPAGGHHASGFAWRPAARLPDRLQIALLRASGCNPNLPETQALIDAWPIAELRGNPQAKRALWPQLRALRRAAGKGTEA